MSATTDATNAVTNCILKLKQLFHNAGADSNATSNGVQYLTNKTISLCIPAGTDNVSVNYYADQDMQLMSAYFTPDTAVANTAANTVFIAVNSHGTEVANVNTDAAGLNALTAGTLEDLSVNTANSKVEAGEYVVCYINHQSGNSAGGQFMLNFDRV